MKIACHRKNSIPHQCWIIWRSRFGESHFLFAKETNQHVVENVIDESHVQDEVVPFVEKVLIGGDVVANDVVSFPSTEERESGPNLELYGIVEIS